MILVHMLLCVFSSNDTTLESGQLLLEVTFQVRWDLVYKTITG